MFKNEVYLIDTKDYYNYKSLGVKMENNIAVPDIKIFEDIDTTKFRKYDIFHLININKVVRNKDLNKYFKNDLYKYNRLIQLYKEFLPSCNKELFDKFKEFNFKADCIIIPESKNDFLREGLSNLFKLNLSIPCYTAMKNKDIELASKDDKEFKFIISEDISRYKNILILDDCKSKGTTISHIKRCFGDDVLFFEVFYCKL